MAGLFFPVSSWFAAFVLTLAVEIPVAAFILRRAEPNFLRLAILIVFANLATHLAVWYVITQLFRVGTLTYGIVAESWAIACESIFYGAAIRGLSPGRAIGVAIVANGLSYLVGRVVGEPLLEPFL